MKSRNYISGINVRDYGAVGDGQHDDFNAIQRAIRAGADYVTIPAGKYLLGDTLRLPSHTRLYLNANAEMIMGNGVGKTIDHFLVTNDHDASDILIDGGIWNGNNCGNPRVDYRNRMLYHGVTVGFRHMEHLILRNMTLRDSEGFHMRLNFVRHFLVENITFDDIHIRPNQDGVHIAGGCEDGVIKNIRGCGASAPNDDMVAIVSDVPAEYNDMDMGDMRGQEHGDIRRIRVEHLRAQNTFSFLRILSCNHKVEDIEISDVKGGCYYLAVQMQVEPLGRIYTGRSVLGTGHIANITLRDFHVWRNIRVCNDFFGSNFPVEPFFHLEQNVRNLRVERFYRDMNKDAFPKSALVVIDNTHKVHLRWMGKHPEDLTRYDPLSGIVRHELFTELAASADCEPEHLIDDTIQTNEAVRIDGAGFEWLMIDTEE